jgi:hypothetical protein
MQGVFCVGRRRWALIFGLLLVVPLAVSGCCDALDVTSLSPQTPVLPSAAIPTWTPAPTFTLTPYPTLTPLPSLTPTGLHGRIVFVRDDPVPNLWTVDLDESHAEQFTFDSGGIEVYVPSEKPPYLIFASVTQPEFDTDEFRWIPLPDACLGVEFSPAGRYVTYSLFADPETRACEPDLHVLDTTTLQVIATVPSSELDFWMTDSVAMVINCYCEGCSLLSLNAKTGEIASLGGASGVRYWSPDQMVFVMVDEPYPGTWRHLWVYDVQEISIIRPEWEADGFLEDSPCWTPDSSHVLYTRQSLTHTNYYTVTIGPRQVMMLDKESGDETMVLGDAEHDYFIGHWDGDRWSCTWRGEWLQVWSTPHRSITTNIEPSGDEWEALRCVLDGQNCSAVDLMALNWRTGELLPWKDAPLPTTILTPTPTFTDTLGPDLAAASIYADPGGAFTLYPGLEGVGLWRVPAEGKPTVLVEDGHYFVYIP